MDSTEVLMTPVVKYSKGKNPLEGNLEADIDTESDCEGESLGVENGSPDTKEEEQTRAVLIPGSFATYVHSFTLALCQGE